jgi:WD40 repeat protein
MKRAWTRGEKWLWAAPLLFGVVAVAAKFGPDAGRRAMGWPHVLNTTPTNHLIAIAVSRDGSVLAATGRGDSDTAPESGKIYLWDARTLSPLPPFNAQYWKKSKDDYGGFLASGLALSPDGKLLGVNDRGQKGYAVYDVESQRELWRAPGYISSAAFSPDGRFVALNGVKMHEAQTGKVVANWRAPIGDAHEFRFAPDGKTVAWISSEKKRSRGTNFKDAMPPNGKAVEIRRVSDGKTLHTLKNSEETEAVAFSPDGTKIVSVSHGTLNMGSVDGSSVRCHSTNGKLFWHLDYRQSNPKRVEYATFSDALFSPDGTQIAVRGMQHGVQSTDLVLILDAANGEEIKRFTLEENKGSYHTVPPALAFPPDGKRLFVRGKNAVLVWDLK